MIKKRVVLLLLCIFLLAPGHSLAAKNQFVKSSVRLETGPRITYWVYVPAEPPAGEKTMVIFLHGSGERGERGLAAGLPSLINQGKIENFPAVVLVPQLPKQGSWLSIEKQVLAIIDTVAQEQGIRPENIFLSGFSMGATFAWELAGHHPGKFSKLLSVSGRVGEELTPDLFAQCDVWVYVGKKDVNVPPSASVPFAQMLMEAGYSARISELAGTHSQMQRNAFLEEETLAWLCQPVESMPEEAGE